MDDPQSRLTRPGLRPGPASYPSASSRTPSPYCPPGSSSQVPLMPVHLNGSNAPEPVFLSQTFNPIEHQPELPVHSTIRLTAISNVKHRGLAPLNFWPPILKWYSTLSLTVLYLATASAITALWLAAGTNGQYHLSSENVLMISRYFPSALGTVNVLLFRQVVCEFIRMKPFIAMADQEENESSGEIPSKCVTGAFFPWQDIMITRGATSIVSLLCQVMVTFVVSLKVALLASGPAKGDQSSSQEPVVWTLTLRVWPALFLIVVHIVMAAYVPWVAYLNHRKSTGLRWDPITIADFVALFASCNVAEYFSALELLHDRKAKKVLSTNHRFRLGYWMKSTDESPGEIVYGIGTTWNARGCIAESYTPTWYERLAGNEKAPSSVDECENYNANDQHLPCNQGTWPYCEHYPYRHSPGCGKGWIVFAMLLVWTSLGVAIYGLASGFAFHPFHLKKDWSLPSDVSVSAGNHTIDLPPIDPTDPKSELVAYALVFRSAPVYVAGMFTSTIVNWVDLNMRFMQPFINMIDKPGDVADTVLLAYITTSPLQVTLTAIERGHYRVAIFSTLNTLSPLFPIFIGGLLTLKDGQDVVIFTFSLSAYIGIIVFLGAWSITMPIAWPFQRRLLPRQFYSMADLMAMCHKSSFLERSYLDFADQKRTPSKDILEARISLSGDRFLFGHYTDDHDRKHIGFDIHSTVNYNDHGRIKDTHLVQGVTAAGELKAIQTQTLQTMTNLFGNTGRIQRNGSGGNTVLAWLHRIVRQHRRKSIQPEQHEFTSLPRPPAASATGSHLEGQQGPRQRQSVAFASPH